MSDESKVEIAEPGAAGVAMAKLRHPDAVIVQRSRPSWWDESVESEPDTRRRTNFDHFLASSFNYWDEILPAKTNYIVEAAMVMKLMNDPGNRLSFKQAQDAVHNLVHVENHFFVTEGPAPDTGPSEMP